MKKYGAFLAALFLALSAFAAPLSLSPKLSDRGRAAEPAVLLLDQGAGDVALVIVADRALLPAASELVKPAPGRPRVIAFLLNGGGLDAVGGGEALAREAAALLEEAKLRRACILGCGSCAEAAIGLQGLFPPASGLVILDGDMQPSIALRAGAYVASAANAGVFEYISASLRPESVIGPRRQGWKPLVAQ
jgi:hypothetical protein